MGVCQDSSRCEDGDAARFLLSYEHGATTSAASDRLEGSLNRKANRGRREVKEGRNRQGVARRHPEIF
jgi:hypothetical protein